MNCGPLCMEYVEQRLGVKLTHERAGEAPGGGAVGANMPTRKIVSAKQTKQSLISAPLPLSGNYPACALDSAGRLHVVCEAKHAPTRYGIFYTRRNAAGTKWTDPVLISGKLPYAETPDISVSGDHVVVTFQTQDLGVVSIALAESLDAGKTWA